MHRGIIDGGNQSGIPVVAGAFIFGVWRGYPVGRGLDIGAFGLITYLSVSWVVNREEFDALFTRVGGDG